MDNDKMDVQRIKKQQKWVWGVALSLTAIIVGFAFYTLSGKVCPLDWCMSSLNRFLYSNPNEIGDTLAGFFGAGAFVWVVAAVILQSIELSMQRAEFKNMVEKQGEQADALDEQVKAMKIQVEFFKEESKTRKEIAAGDQLGELYVKMANLLKFNHNQYGWNFMDRNYIDKIPSLKGKNNNEARLWHHTSSDVIDAPHMFSVARRQLEIINPKLGDATKRFSKLSFEPIKKCCDEIEELKLSLSEADKIKLQNDSLDGLLAQLMILYNADIWVEE